ncbi:snRNA-activating protein complex subunit 4 isoform X2 [Platichthys flesus]|uniref:snRNA-activating protein complex subunit 4 isoform X2 n=1 Tax=Platichthys flesus TaxID=8260 RepID=UPI002DBD38E8|nr:snRNA-activating protein complex subunit 4 isoform X2 [Platichthys flesus]
MSVSLSEERDRIQRQVEELEQSLSLCRSETHTDLQLLSSETDDESGSDDEEEESASGLLAQREKIQKEIENLENKLGPQSPVCLSDADDIISSSDESELGISLSVESCLQMNLVYQQVVQETLCQLETLLTHNNRQQRELVSQLSGPIKEPSREQPAPSSYQLPINMYLGRFLKPYFKDKQTGLGPPANQETKEKSSRMTGCLDENKVKIKRWESWQKTLLIDSVSRDSLRRLVQPKLSRVDYLSQKLSSAEETNRQKLREQIDSLEREIDKLRTKKEEELIGDRYEEHDWEKISNIDFEGTREADDIRCFWQNFLHPSIRKVGWSQEEVEQLRDISRRHRERDWKKIAEELGTGRTAFMCLQTFQRFVSDSLRRGSWTPDEDDLLRDLVDKMRIGNFIPYTQMSYFMEGRHPPQLIYRWNQVLDPSLKKGMWTKQEDQLLLRAVSRQGEKDWWKIRLEVPGRTDSACRDRYIDCLKSGMKRGAFDKQEQELLLQLVEKYGVGRWAKIAAEIPQRYDAQCLREWRKVSRKKLGPAQKNKKAKNPQTSGGVKKKRKVNIRRKVKEELSSEEEEEEEEVEYMDSDTDEKKMKEEEKEEVVEVDRTADVEDEVEEYTCPSMTEWIPDDKAKHFSFLNFRPVSIPSSSHSPRGKPVRSTIVGKSGRSVIIGPNPVELQWEERHRDSTMMMVSPDQLQAHLHCQAAEWKKQGFRIKGKQLGRSMDIVVKYKLQAAVMPWIGNLLIPTQTRLTVADALREQGEKTKLSSTPVFQLLLQTMNVDVIGCKETIEQRKEKVGLPTPPPDPASVRRKDPRTVARILQQSKQQKELDLQDKLILTQLHTLQQQQIMLKQPIRTQQLVYLQQPQNLPPQSLPPSIPSQNLPGLPQMSRLSFPQSVFIPHPLLQPQNPLAPSSDTSHLSRCRPPPVGVLTSSSPPLPPVSMVPMLQSPTSSALVQQQTVPLTQRFKVYQSSSPNPAVSIGSTLANQQAVPFLRSTLATRPLPSSSGTSSGQSLPRGRGQKADREPAVKVCVTGAGSDGTYTGVKDEGRRNLKLSQRPRALQEATRAKTQNGKKSASSSRKTTESQRTNSPPQTGLLPPPQHHTALLSSSLSASLIRDHDYFIHTTPPPSQPSPAPKQPDPKHCKSDPVPETPTKHPSRGIKRRRGPEQDGVTSSQDVPCTDVTGDPGAQADRGATQEGKRVRKLSHKARELQKATETKDEAKKKRKSSPCKARPRTSRSKQGTEKPTLHLLPGESVWVMTPGGLVQLALAPPQPHQQALVPTPTFPPAPGNSTRHQLDTPPLRFKPPPVPYDRTIPINLPASPTHPPEPRAPVPSPGCFPLRSTYPQPPPKVFLPCNGTIRVGKASPPPLRREALPFNPSLMFLEPQEAVCDWLSGRRGVVVPGAGVALPYLPPFVSTLSTLRALLQAKNSLTKSALQLLSQDSEPRRCQTKIVSDSGSENTSSQPPPDLPDSTSDLRPAEQPGNAHLTAPTVSSDSLQEEQGEKEEQEEQEEQGEQREQEEQEEVLVAAVRELVTERFSSNPAYQLLKARFLSLFTVPALLATIQPITEETVARPATQEEEEEEEEEEEQEEVAKLKKIKERGRQRAQGSRQERQPIPSQESTHPPLTRPGQ